MPGGRLTLQDRRDIASGLAEGLGYAEIARRLQRPTSTVSREVNRNGGHNGYRAEQAHRTATRLAHRHKTAPVTPTETPPDAVTDVYGRDCAAVHEFEQRFRQMVIEAGFPRMMAMVLISVYTTDSGSLTATELVEHLHVSPASISKAVQYLERMGFARRERDPRRRERYVIDEDIWDGVFRRQAQSMAEWGAIVREGADMFDPTTPAGARLDRLSQFLMFHHNEMVQANERWRQFIEEERPAPSPINPEAFGT